MLIVILIYHCYKPLDLIHISFVSQTVGMDLLRTKLTNHKYANKRFNNMFKRLQHLSRSNQKIY
jgi:hypothetical protein